MFKSLIIVMMLSITSIAGWTSGDFVDEFGDRTGERYYHTAVKGVMSNTATNGSPATLEIYIKNDGSVYISIDEYGRSPVVGYSSGVDYHFAMKGNVSGKEEFVWQWYNTSAIFFGPSYSNKFKAMFKSNSSVTLVVTNMRTQTSKYKFVIDCTNFKIPF